jgi:S1-C subfamily serine protease
MMRGLGLNSAAVAFAFLSVSNASPVSAQASPAAALAPGTVTRPVELSRLIADFRRGQPMGKYKQGAFCGPWGGKLEWNVTWNAPLTWEDLAKVFLAEVRSAGFKSIGEPTLFDTGSGLRSEHLVGGVIETIDLNLCFPYLSSGQTRVASGRGTVVMTWQIFSKAENKVIATVRTQGSGSQKEEGVDGDAQIIYAAFAENVRNLIASNEFRSTFIGQPGPAAGATSAPGSVIDLPRPKKAVASIGDAVASTVLIFSDQAFGSGFLVSDNGYVLTNQHVVKTAKYVKVRWSDGTESLGEVVRSDAKRDVALIKTEANGHLPLATRGAVTVGEDVFAIGAPLDPQMQSSVTKGIVSSPSRTIDGQRFIQSDVAVNPGNSGGPLLDKQSQLVGMTVAGLAPEGVPVGVNLFIPISDAFVSLGLRTASAQ